MQAANGSAGPVLPCGQTDGDDPMVRLRLYVARSTPNSVRAQSNLLASLADIGNEPVWHALEIIDVFSQPGRAITEGVIVTPTLVALGHGRRIVLIGDLANRDRLDGTLRSLMQPD